MTSLTLHGKRDVLIMKLNVYEDVNGTRKYSSMEILK